MKFIGSLLIVTALLIHGLARLAQAQPGPETDRAHTDSIRALNEYVLFLYNQRLLDSAMLIANQATNLSTKWLGDSDPLTGVSFNTLGTLYFGRGNLVEAASLYTSAINIWKRNPPPDSSIYGAALSNLATIERAQGQAELSLRHFKQSLVFLREAEDINRQQVAGVNEAIAEIYRTSDSCEASLPFWAEAVELRREFIGPPRWATGMALIGQGMCQLAVGQLKPAEASLSEALQIARLIFQPDHMSVALALEHVVNLRLTQRRSGVAVKLAKEAVGIVQVNTPANDPGRGSAQLQLAKAYLSNGQLAEAELALVTAITIFEKSPQVRAAEYLEALSTMINVYQRTGRQQGAQELLNRLNQAGARLLQQQGD